MVNNRSSSVSLASAPNMLYLQIRFSVDVLYLDNMLKLPSNRYSCQIAIAEQPLLCTNQIVSKHESFKIGAEKDLNLQDGKAKTLSIASVIQRALQALVDANLRLEQTGGSQKTKASGKEPESTVLQRIGQHTDSRKSTMALRIHKQSASSIASVEETMHLQIYKSHNGKVGWINPRRPAIITHDLRKARTVGYRSVVIQRRVEDLQLGVESYQKKLNLTKPDTHDPSGNDQVAKIMGYGNYQIGNVTISRVYYVEELGHNLFFVRQFCDSNLEVAFRQHTCFIHNLEGVDSWVFIMKMEILLEPTSNKLMVEHAEYDESNTYVLERFNTTAGNPVKKILLKLNLSDHRLFKMVVEVPDSSWLTRSIATCSYPTDKHKDIMKAQVPHPQLALNPQGAQAQECTLVHDPLALWDQLIVPIHHSPDKVVIGATALLLALDVSSANDQAVVDGSAASFPNVDDAELNIVLTSYGSLLTHLSLRASRNVYCQRRRNQVGRRMTCPSHGCKDRTMAMPTWCHMFNSTLTGNAGLWFDDLPTESIDSYNDLKKAFLENYLQHKKCIKDPIKLYNIKQRDGESTEDFVRRRILEPAEARKEARSIHAPHKNSYINFCFRKKEIQALPPMTTLIEKRNHTKFCEFHGEVRHNTDECMHLKKQIEEMLKAENLSHLIKELKQNNGKEQPKAAKKGETSRKGKAVAILMVQPWERVVRQKITQSFSPNTEILFPPLDEGEGTEGPMIIEAEIEGHCIHRMYVDGGSALEILYEHYFNRIRLKIKNQLVPATTPLIGFSGEIIWPIGQIQLLVRIGDEEHSTSAWMNFVVVRSPSSYNGIIGRPGVRKLQAVLSTTHGMLKLPVEGGVITLKSSMLVSLECALVSGPEETLPATKPMVEERFKVAINPEYLE
ncbi:reverse transcriptase domain-containing protein [Tanacetum coccineum]|uniref:Reverse transcriptase domain-containing protein n=1 Tax=Tanacetum coccineum TaxID=301880 RepID=A0ABQ5BNV0_9ASTR